ncbi:DUF952 domain-containing protein [Streptomyces sp. SCSIO 30461]|uniref:DUF952 domain-containing protein n=1 Tax=Streptomyces sp. SCSIO 30461 TaxID=3118085 RepID=UPI0030CAD5CF
MIIHVVPLDDWLAIPERPYAPPSFAAEGFIHCSPDEATALAIADAYYRKAPGPLMALLIDEDRLRSPVRHEPAGSSPPAGVSPDTLFPHVYGPIDRDAVQGLLEIRRDAQGRAVEFAPWA